MIIKKRLRNNDIENMFYMKDSSSKTIQKKKKVNKAMVLGMHAKPSTSVKIKVGCISTESRK